MDKKWTADELFNAVKNMENGERWKFLEMMFDEYSFVNISYSYSANSWCQYR